MIKNLKISVLMCCMCALSFAQNDSITVEAVKAISAMNDNSVLLRWAPTTPVTWQKGNMYGYIIERYTVKRNGQLLPRQEKTLLTPEPLKAEPLAQWEQMVHENQYAAIIAQAIYGESFEVEAGNGNKDNSLMQIVNKAREVEQRFSFSLFAADMNFEAAKKAGWGYVDNDIKSNEAYFYRILIALPEGSEPIQEGLAYADPAEVKELPVPIDLFAVGQDKNISLTWEYELFKSTYNSYHIERSEDGVNFARLGDTPFVKFEGQNQKKVRYIQYIDTIPQNNKTYHYRVKGLTAFGEEGPPSAVVSAMGVEALSSTPHIGNYKFLDGDKVLIEWEFPVGSESQITGFELNRGLTHKGPFEVVKNGLQPHERQVIFEGLDPSNYFTVSALGKDKEVRASSAKFIQTIDSIPPAAPTGLTAVVDTMGIVHLSWEANKERDILGYRILRANIASEEYHQLTESPIETISYKDTVSLKTLNAKVYYRVMAVDQRFNRSGNSDVLMVDKPDFIPPSAPIFTDYKITDGSINLTWVNSSSSDTQKHKLFRQAYGTESAVQDKWQLIFETDTVTTYSDKDLTSGYQYRYAIFAEDKAGLLSEASAPLTADYRSTTTTIEAIKGFIAIPDRSANKIELKWRTPPEEVVEIMVYKSKDNETPVLWRQVPAHINELTDTGISPNNIYVYRVKAVLKDGVFTKIITHEVNY